MSAPFETSRLVEFHDTDMAGIMHFAAFFRHMEAAEHALLRSLGLSVYSKLADGAAISFPRVNVACDFRSPAKCEDLLDISVSVRRLGEKSVTYGFLFKIGDRLVAEGEMTSVCCRIVAESAPKSMPIPASIAEGLRPFLVE